MLVNNKKSPEGDDVSIFTSTLQNEIEESIQGGDPIDLFLKNEYGIENPNELEFYPDLTNKNQEDFIFTNVRGSVPMQLGNILTVKETRKLSEQVAKMDFNKMLIQFK